MLGKAFFLLYAEGEGGAVADFFDVVSFYKIETAKNK
jgi:hypothetical protein